MALDIVPGSEVQTPTSGVKINASAFRQQALAKGALIGSAATIGDVVQDVGQKMQAAVNTKHILDADIAFRDFNQNYIDNLSQNPDPDTWVQNYNAGFNQKKSEILNNPKLGSDVRQHIANMADDVQASHAINIRTSANLAKLTDLQDTGLKDVNNRINSLSDSFDDIKRPLDHLKDLGAISKKRYDEELASIPSRMDIAKIDHRMTMDAAGTLMDLDAVDKNGKYINYTGLTEEQRRIKRTQVEGQASRQEVKFNSDLNQKIDIFKENGGHGDPPFTLQSLRKDYVSTGKISENVANTLYKKLAGVLKPEEINKANDSIQSELDKLPMGMNNYMADRELARFTRTPEWNMLPRETRSAYVKQINDKKSKVHADTMKDNPVLDEAYKQIDQAVEKEFLAFPYSKTKEGDFVMAYKGFKELEAQPPKVLKEKYGADIRQLSIARNEYINSLKNKMYRHYMMVKDNYKNDKQGLTENLADFKLKLEGPIVSLALTKSMMPKEYPTFRTPEEAKAAIDDGVLSSGDTYLDKDGVPRKVK